MARQLTTALLTPVLMLAVGAWAQSANTEQEAIEEIVVTAPRTQTNEPEQPQQPRWRISEQTRQKLESPVQVGYDPELDEVRQASNQIDSRDNAGEPQPVTVLRADF